MGMNVGSSGPDDDPTEMVDINTTPLIDVMLVLLIMLIITIPIQTHAVKLDLPVNQDVPPPEAEPPPVVRVEVDFDGTIYWDGLIVRDRQELAYRFQQAANAPVKSEFHIRPNRLAAYKHVAGVMATAQRLGITNIGIVGVN